MNYVICIMGPTASGKTDLAVYLQDHFPVQIISVDSAMVYHGMDIGTAKPSAELLAKAPHRLLDIRDPSQPYSAADFRQDALQAIKEIHQAGAIPLLVGGTMLYFRVLQQGLSVIPPADAGIRQRLLDEATQHGWDALYKRLQRVDPVSAQRIHAHDPQRLQRALEVYELTGQPLSKLHENTIENEYQYPTINIALAPADRTLLHQRITERFHKMLQQGFIDEVQTLQKRGDLHADLPAIRAVGYRQVWAYLNNEYDYDTMINKAVIATRQLAKRQLTWLRSWPEITWFDSSISGYFVQVLTFLQGQVRKM